MKKFTYRKFSSKTKHGQVSSQHTSTFVVVNAAAVFSLLVSVIIS